MWNKFVKLPMGNYKNCVTCCCNSIDLW